MKEPCWQKRKENEKEQAYLTAMRQPYCDNIGCPNIDICTHYVPWEINAVDYRIGEEHLCPYWQKRKETGKELDLFDSYETH